MTLNLTKNFHPLFPKEPESPDDYEPEEFARIKVIRMAAYGPLAKFERGTVTVPRMYTPEELDSLERFYELFGGGSYEIRAQRDNGQFYTRRTLVLAGDSKSLVPDLGNVNGPGIAATSMGEGSSGVPSGLDPMTAMLFQMMMKSEERALAQAAEDRRAQAARDATNQQTLATIITAVAGIAGSWIASSGNKENVLDSVRALAELTRANQPPAPPVSASAAIKETLETSRLIREAAASQSQAAPEESASSIIKSVGEVAAPFVMKMMEAAGEKTLAAASSPFPMVP